MSSFFFKLVVVYSVMEFITYLWYWIEQLFNNFECFVFEIYALYSWYVIALLLLLLHYCWIRCFLCQRWYSHPIIHAPDSRGFFSEPRIFTYPIFMVDCPSALQIKKWKIGAFCYATGPFCILHNQLSFSIEMKTAIRIRHQCFECYTPLRAKDGFLYKRRLEK